jgi:hypothetical protein
VVENFQKTIHQNFGFKKKRNKNIETKYSFLFLFFTFWKKIAPKRNAK